MSNKAKLFLIDCQNDFCSPKGALYVKGAENDMSRLSKMIHNNLDNISDIIVTLDSHNLVDVAHPIYWIDSNGKHPDPFTIISVSDVESGKWRSTNPEYQERSVNYVKELSNNGKNPLCVWPLHVLYGGEGWNIYPELMNSLLEWEGKFNIVTKVTKGLNTFTEHYSVFKADVIDPFDKHTWLNETLIDHLISGNDDILIAGEALSHCVLNSVKDLVNEISYENISRLVLLTDATSNVWSPVPELTELFKGMGDSFITEMLSKGMRVSTTEEYFSNH